MVTENVDIRFRETGARVIVRRLEEMGEAANRSTRGIFLLQRAIFVLGGAGAVRAISRQVDLLTNVENRLKLTTVSSQNLEEVQTRLFQVARESRSAWESVAEIYSRTALSVKNLGISQQETIRFTESLAKASILSGASTREANAALIQLSQGLASNRLSGDELRSVLEQLPFVADVIAKHMGITRGELRKFGREGKISAQVVLEAFRGAADEIDGLFAQTNVTIGQALNVANTNWLQFLDNLDDTLLISDAVARGIIFLSENISGLINTLTILAGAWALSFGATQVSRILAFVGGLKATAVAMTRIREVETLRAAASVRRAQAQVSASAARQAELSQRSALLAVQKAQLQQEVLEAQFVVKNGQARSLSTGQYVSLTGAKANLARVTNQLSIVEGVEAATAGRLAQARLAQTGATTTLAGANARLAGAQAAASTTTARLNAAFPLLTGLVLGATNAVRGLFALLLANPFTVIATAIIAATTALVLWGDKIKLTADGLVTLKGFAVATFQIIAESARKIGNQIYEFFRGPIVLIADLWNIIVDGFNTAMTIVVSNTKAIVNAIIGLFVGAYYAVTAAWDLLPAAFADLGTRALNALIAIVEAGIRSIIKAVQALLSFIGSAATLIGAENPFEGILDPQSINIPRVTNQYAGAMRKVGSAAAGGFAEGFSTDFVGNTVDAIGGQLENGVTAIMDRARRNATIQAEDMLHSLSLTPLGRINEPTDTGAGSGSGSGGSGGIRRDFASEIAQLQKQIELEKQWGLQKQITNEQLRIEKALKRDLTQQEIALLEQTVKSLEVAKIQGEILESILGPQEKLILGQEALNNLLDEGAISLENYNTKLREMQIAADQASGTLQGGFRAAIASAIQSASQLGDALGGVVVGAADSAADAIVEFAKTGRINIRAFFADLFAQIAKLIAKQLILRALGFILGVPVGGGGGGLLGFSSGGSILPTGPGSTDTQIVSFAKRPDERVDILTPGQQDKQRLAMDENKRQSREQFSQEPPVVVVVQDRAEMVNVMASYEGRQTIIAGLREEGVI